MARLMFHFWEILSCCRLLICWDVVRSLPCEGKVLHYISSHVRLGFCGHCFACSKIFYVPFAQPTATNLKCLQSYTRYWNLRNKPFFLALSDINFSVSFPRTGRCPCYGELNRKQSITKVKWRTKESWGLTKSPSGKPKSLPRTGHCFTTSAAWPTKR